ncbi:MAG: hypothetical protein RI958_1575 [Actinomycetota bacterium]
MLSRSGRRPAPARRAKLGAVIVAALVATGLTTGLTAGPVEAVAPPDRGQPPGEIPIGRAVATPPDVAGAGSPDQPRPHLVSTADSASLDLVVAALERRGTAVAQRWDGAVTGLAADLTLQTVELVRRLPGVLHVERDKPMTLEVDQANPPWGLDRVDQRARPLDNRYSTPLTGAGVTAYVIDSGLNFGHVEFSGRVTAAAYVDFGDGLLTADCLGHGTHVTGTLGGTTYGVAKRVSIVPVKVFPCSSTTNTSNIVAGINWVVSHHLPGVPAVANLSLGSSTVSPSLDLAVEALIDDGITTVVAAGNDALDSCTTSPARVPAAITVAASDSLDRRATFSNFGACNDLFAPGVAVVSAGISSPTAAVTLSGTSMAAPHAAGAAALLLGGAPTLAPADVWAGLDTLATPGVVTGTGAADPDTLLYVEPLTAQLQSLSVTIGGSGVGSVTSVPSGVDCTATCSTVFATDTIVTLTATSSGASVFEGWTGEGCSGTGTCTVTMTSARAVTATFSTPLSYELGITLDGDGGGFVVSNPSGIDCGTSCAATFAADTVVTLNASADTGSTFIGWAGAGCSGVDICVVTMATAQSVTATFSSDADKPLTVALDGSGSGTVLSEPAGIDCGLVCVATFPAGTVVTLSAVADDGSVLTGWSGATCAGTGDCVVTMSASRSVTATFLPVGELPTAPNAPLAPTAVLLEPFADVALSWLAPFDGRSPIVDYLVEYSVDGIEWQAHPDAVSTETATTIRGLVRGEVYSFRVSAVNEVGTGSPSPPSNDVSVPPAGFVPISPVRLFDTRPGEPDGVIAVPKVRVDPAGVLRITVADVAGVPLGGVAAVALNVTVTEPDTPGFVTVHPCGELPRASNLNFVAGQTVPNSVIAPVSPDGAICFFSNTPTHLLADISGYFAAEQSLTTVTPVRLFDTRPAYEQGLVPVTQQLYGPAAGVDRVLRVNVADLVGVTPSAAEIGAVVLNVTATETVGAGFVTVYPCGPLPTVSNLNFVADQTVPNLVIAPVSADGDICLYANSPTHLVADISGWFTKGPGTGDMTPTRVFDTRPDEPQWAVPVVKVPVGAAVVLEVHLAGLAGVPAQGTGAVALNVTATGSTVPGFVTVYPCGSIPTASNVNFTAGQTVPNSVIAPLSPDGRVCFAANTPTHLVVDVSAWFPA